MLHYPVHKGNVAADIDLVYVISDFGAEKGALSYRWNPVVLVFWGSVAANNQPVSTKYMYAAKKAGTKIIMINPYLEPSMEKYWIPSIAESALFQTSASLPRS